MPATIILPTAPCGSGRTLTSVDLVVIIDTSDSMGDEANEVSRAAAAAVEAAAISCPSDLRVQWFGIEGIWPGTQFSESYRSYLHRLGLTDAELVGTPGDTEDGGAAIIDLCNHFDWRRDAARAIFLLGDEGLEAGSPQDEADEVAANAAIEAALNTQVKVYTYAGQGILAPIAVEFARLAQETGGQAFAAPASNLGGFETVLQDIICAGVVTCAAVEMPKVGPCFEIHRASETDDPIHTHDVERLALIAYNPYTNLLFKELTVFLSLVRADGQALDLLPDGLPSVFVKPANPICLGDLLPCHPDRLRDSTRLRREIVLVSRGAPVGDYRIKLDYFFGLELTGASEFKVQLVA